jgi:GH24 family phage-related lysozyme (muramidase)
MIVASSAALCMAVQPSPLAVPPTARMSADQLALREKANAAWKPAYSPVQHWTQGLGRIADGLSHGIEQRRHEKEAAAIESDKAWVPTDEPKSIAMEMTAHSQLN